MSFEPIVDDAHHMEDISPWRLVEPIRLVGYMFINLIEINNNNNYSLYFQRVFTHLARKKANLP